MQGYLTNVLYAEDVKLGSVSLEEFTNIIKTALHTATFQYKEECTIKADEYVNNIYRKQLEERYQKYANEKYKKETTRKQYVEKMVQQSINNYLSTKQYDITFDLKINPAQNWIHAYAILKDGKTTDHDIELIYNDIQQWEFKDNIIGISVEYEYSKNRNTMEYAFRPDFKLVYDAKTEQILTDREQQFNKSVSDFYAGSNWWGD